MKKIFVSYGVKHVTPGAAHLLAAVWFDHYISACGRQDEELDMCQKVVVVQLRIIIPE